MTNAFFHTTEWTLNVNCILSVEWDDESQEAEVTMINSLTYTVVEEDYRRLAELLGR